MYVRVIYVLITVCFCNKGISLRGQELIKNSSVKKADSKVSSDVQSFVICHAAPSWTNLKTEMGISCEFY